MEGLNMKISGGQSGSNLPNKTTLNSVINFIKEKKYDDYVTNKLIQKASRYPHSALPAFVKNIRQYIQQINRERQNEES